MTYLSQNSKKIGILSSHNGSGYLTIDEACKKGKLDADVVVVISNNTNANVLNAAKNRGTDTHVINDKLYPYENLDMKKALKILSNKKLGIVVVQNKQKKTTGIITDGQIRRFNQKTLNLHFVKVKNIMTKSPISIEKDALAAKALSLMNSKKITSLCVTEKKNKFKTIGVVHIHNILKFNIS